MTLVPRKYINPVNEADYREEPFDVKERFVVYAPKPHNPVLDILKKHEAKQKEKKLQESREEESRAMSAISSRRSISPHTSSASFFPGSSKLREKLSSAVSHSRRSDNGEISSQNAEVQEHGLIETQERLETEENDEENLAVEGQAEVVSPAQLDPLNTSQARSPLYSSSGNRPATRTFNPVEGSSENQQQGTQELQKDATSPSEIVSPSKESLKQTVVGKEKPQSKESPLPAIVENEQPQTAEQNWQQINAYFGDAQTLASPKSGKSPVKPLGSSSQIVSPLQRGINRKNITARGERKEGTFSFQRPAQLQSQRTITSPSARTKNLNTSGTMRSPKTLTSPLKSSKLIFESIINDRLQPVENSPNAFFGTLQNFTPTMSKKNPAAPFFTSEELGLKTATSPLNTRQIQYDYETRSYVSTLLKEKVMDNMRKYEDVILSSQPLLTGLAKLKEMRLLKQNPVLVRRYRGVDEFNFINNGNHSKNTNPGYNRNVFGGFYER